MSARQFVRRVVARLRPHVRGACRCPACDKTEQAVRAELGMPALHPERIARQLRHYQEEWLTEVAAELWPDDEYTTNVADPGREDEA